MTASRASSPLKSGEGVLWLTERTTSLNSAANVAITIAAGEFRPLDFAVLQQHRHRRDNIASLGSAA